MHLLHVMTTTLTQVHLHAPSFTHAHTLPILGLAKFIVEYFDFYST